MKLFKFVLPLLLAAALVYVLDRSWGALPPLGKLFSPSHGFFQHIEGPDAGRSGILSLPGLKEEVIVHYDDNGVPHIFAGNDYDLYYAQGYVVAKDRLWQMDFQVLAAAGRLTEVVGNAALELDRYHRRIGMAKTAQEVTDRLERQDSLSFAILQAYADGVNDYIASLRPRDYPLEYKILNYAPEDWSPYRSILMLMNMRHDLSTGTDDYRMSNLIAKLGEAVTDDLFPFYPDRESPIIPVGTAWDFEPLGLPPVPAIKMAVDTAGIPLASLVETPAPRPEIGSNNWAVAGSRSASGLPLLSNDPHLTLSLPSIWYQMQLSAPGVNVYGVALPGTPAIIIGFNKDIAWGVTNVGLDVMDFYRIQFRDAARQEYWYDGQWKPVTARIEVYHQKNGPDIVDTVYYTHHGPVVYEEKDENRYRRDFPVGYAMRWMGNDSEGADLLTFHYLNRGENYDDYRQALTYFTSPAQNFVFASNGDDIAITPNGKFPLKWKGQGRYLLDGALPEHDWQGWIPNAHNPTVRNPARGFVSSANQFPADLSYPYYLDWSFAPSSRAIRINERLDAMHGANIDSLSSLLHDNFNVDARLVLPDLLATLAVDDSIAGMQEYQLLAAWNLVNGPEEVGASIFERWIPELRSGIWWDDMRAEGPVRTPSLDRTFSLLLQEADSPWFDDRGTDGIVETKFDIVRRTFLKSIADLREGFGEYDGGNWHWAKVKNTTIAHLVPNFTMFSRTGIVSGGGGGIVNATSGRHGPSWRMVVALDQDWPEAVGLFPGGQSGNPGSPYYDNMIDKWANGILNPLVFLKDRDSGDTRLRTTMTLQPKTK